MGLSVLVGVGLAGAAQDRFVESPARAIPVVDRVDIVVVGGSEGGMAAAWKAAKLGARVILLNETTFLGSEVTAKGRFHLAPGPAPSMEFSRALFADMTPSRYRMACDALMQQAGVVLLANTRPGGVLVDEAGGLCGVVTANKAGLQAVVAKVVIDATYAGAVADAAGARRAPWNVKTLAVSRVRQIKKGEAPEELVIEAPMPELTWPLINRAEAALRGEAQEPVGSAFAYSMDFVMPTAILARTNDDRLEFPGAAALDLGVCEPQGVGRLLVMGSSSAVSRGAVRRLMHPVVLAEVGERLGAHAVEMAARVRQVPSKVAVKVPALPGAAVQGLSVRELNERERPFRPRAAETVAQPAVGLPVWADYDVVVVGSGPAGHSAAIAAARAGVRVLMIEQAGFIGGNVAMGVRGFWRGYRRGFNQAWGPGLYPKMLRDAGVDIWVHSLAMGAVMDGTRVAGVEVATWLGRGVALGRIVIDASGEGDVCAAAGADSFYLNDGDLCLEEASFRDIGLNSNVVPLDPIDIVGSTLHHMIAPRAGKVGWDFMPMSQIRETRRIRGDHVIDELDVNAGRTYRDVVAIALSAFDPHGYYSSDATFGGLMLSCKHVKESVTVYIPLRAVIPAGLEGLFMAGRCHSMTHDVQAMVRMNPDVINEGYAVGHAAALCVKDGTPTRRVDLGKLQRHLAEVDILPAEDLSRITVDTPDLDDRALAAAAGDPSQRTNLLTLARGGSRSVAPLKASFAAEPTFAKARALCLLGDATGVPFLAAWLEKEPMVDGAAYDWEGFMKGVPDLESAMWVLGIPRDRRAVPALVGKLRQCGPGTGFNAVRAVTMALGRIGDPDAARPLAEFLKRPGVGGHMNAGDDPATMLAPQFSRAMIELFAASALVRCGDADGLGRGILTGYLGDWRGVFVRYAGHVLAGTPPAVNPR
jgi:NADPH-dependent 2,4-dienoyl-CoA reductase/sulfur reductase-like enzyme